MYQKTFRIIYPTCPTQAISVRFFYLDPYTNQITKKPRRQPTPSSLRRLQKLYTAAPGYTKQIVLDQPVGRIVQCKWYRAT